MTASLVSCHRNAASRIGEVVTSELRRLGGATCSPRRILIKPNWVMHEVDRGLSDRGAGHRCRG